MPQLSEGDPAPDFALGGLAGMPARLGDLRGRPVVVYFYPQDNTPSCTKEAIDFTAMLPEFEAEGVAVIGVSPDSAKKHEGFARKHGLRHTLLADTGKEVIGRYGVWIEKTTFGRTYMGVERATFLIDPKGRIARIWHGVRVNGHAEEVLAAAREIKDSAGPKPKRRG